MKIRNLFEGPFLLLDGAMGTMLQRMGLPAGQLPESFNLTHPRVVADIHTAYLQAGARAVTTNTFGASPAKLAQAGLCCEEVIGRAVEIARRAAEPFGGLVGLDIGPLGELLEPMGPLSFEEAYALFARQVRQGAQSGADYITIETMSDLYEAKAAILAAKENSSLPVFCTMTFQQDGRTFTGCDIPCMALTLSGLGVDALGINCSLGPVEIRPLAEELARWTDLPLIVKPNAGLPRLEGGRTVYSITREEFADKAADYLSLGVGILGGCCGTDPETIALLAQRLAGRAPTRRPASCRPAAACSGTQHVAVDQVRVIGERLNPTGKKALKKALQEGDMAYLQRMAVEQAQQGAHLLDVNVGVPGVDQEALMVRSVKAIQAVTGLPLQVDASDPAVIAAALRAYNGKAVVNSVNGEEENLQAVLPLVKKYGAAVVGLTLDKGGIPPTAEGRLAIARRILQRAMELGIPRQDVWIDCLTLTVSAEPAAARETLRAVALVKKELGLKTVLGVSNISFGLPGRGPLNLAFFTMALQQGLDLAILNPAAQEMMDAAAAFSLLSGGDPGGRAYIARFGGQPAAPAPAAGRPATLEYAVENGLAAQAAGCCQALLQQEEPLAIIQGRLIPALDRVGKRYESQQLFLPQLLQAAEAAGAAFELLKEAIARRGGAKEGGGRILVATVEGDIHDIGKNIVKTVLENYGYQLIDLGRDVPAQRVVQEAIRRQVPLVGLSALMTTTLPSMEKTIAALRQSGHDCKIFVGGAVLTAPYAAQIGADFYAADAQQAVEIARRVLGR